jgi:hypothetical protein
MLDEIYGEGFRRENIYLPIMKIKVVFERELG